MTQYRKVKLMDILYYNGVSEHSSIYFHTPDRLQPDFLAYPLCAGHYFCDSSYEVTRSSYNSFLLLYTRSGQGSLTTGSLTRRLNPGDLCLIDCYRPHSYTASGPWEIMWLHYDGGNSRAFFDYLSNGTSFFHTMLSSPAAFEECWQRVCDALRRKEQANPIILSQNIMQLLTFAGASTEQSLTKKEANVCIDASLNHIHSHLCEALTLPKLARLAALSPFYFTRCFKARTGYTPHRYILISRINLAKFLLTSSRDTVKNIGFLCGFNSEHSFCATFKKETGSTPSQYRASGL